MASSNADEALDLSLRKRAVAAQTITDALDPIASRQLERLLLALEGCPPTLEELLNARANLIAWRLLTRSLNSFSSKLE